MSDLEQQFEQFELGEAPYSDPTFSQDIIAWQKLHGRHTLPWQNTRDAYRIWLSEIMLQQTQVATVIPYYQRFLRHFPDIYALAQAAPADVMAHWSGLGYYSRARNLQRCAQQVVAEHGGVFPSDPERLAQLPGIGRSTAAAIAVFAYGARAAILDGNVKRVFARVFGIAGDLTQKKWENPLWQRAQALVPHENTSAYIQGLMDLGASICNRSKPDCPRCPLASRCIAWATDRVHELPTRKIKQKIPEKHTALLVITDRGQVLLQQRPDHGIWGGLLSLPEIAGPENNLDCPVQTRQWQAQAGQLIAPFGVAAFCEPLQIFSHSFTHFKLHIKPYRITLAHRLHTAGQTTHVWLDVRLLKTAPLPAPVKKLLLAVLQPD